MFEKEWFPKAYKIGISWNDFWEMNPRKIMLIAEGYNERLTEKLQIENQIAYIQGQYFIEAIMATVGNMLSKKGSRPYLYPKQPYNTEKKKPLTEEEKEIKRQEFVAKMQALKATFDANKKEAHNE